MDQLRNVVEIKPSNDSDTEDEHRSYEKQNESNEMKFCEFTIWNTFPPSQSQRRDFFDMLIKKLTIDEFKAYFVILTTAGVFSSSKKFFYLPSQKKVKIF